MARNHYTRFKEGVQISGVTLNIHQKGKVIYVSNSAVPAALGSVGSNSNKGLTPENPVASLATALSLVVANRGDKIVVLPGHAETVSAAAAMDFSVAGVSIIGVGKGSQRPTITLDTANTATVQVSASDVALHNMIFVGNFLAIATCIKLKNATVAKNVTIEDVEFRDTSNILGFAKAITTSTTDNDNDGLTIRNCLMSGTGTTAATSMVNVVGAIDRLTVEDNNVFIQGTTATTGALVLATGKTLTATAIVNNNVSSPLTTSAAGALIVAGTGGSGVVRNNYVYVPAAATAILSTTGTGLGFVNNYITRSAVDTSGLLLPAASS